MSIKISPNFDQQNEVLDIFIYNQDKSIDKGRIPLKEINKDKKYSEIWTLKNNSKLKVSFCLKTEIPDRSDSESDECDSHRSSKYRTEEILNTQPCVKDSPFSKKSLFGNSGSVTDLPSLKQTLEDNPIDTNKVTFGEDNHFFKNDSHKITKHLSSAQTTVKFISNDISSSLSLPNNTDTMEECSFAIPSHAGYTLISYTEYDAFDFEASSDRFIDCFFTVGVGLKSQREIPDSENFCAPCKHFNCSLLQAYRPEVIDRFPLTSNANMSSFELSNVTAGLCFPNGIKFCFEQNEDKIKPLEDFVTVTTNEEGERHYIHVFHYYTKMEMYDFTNTFKFNPVASHLQNDKLVKLLDSGDINIGSDKQSKSKLIENYSKSSELAQSDIIYVPKAACIVSKAPFPHQLKTCNEVLVKMLLDKRVSTEEFQKVLQHLIFEIPLPYNNYLVAFNLLYEPNPIEITGIIYKNLPVCCYSPRVLFEFFSCDNILMLIQLILLEQKLLFIYDDFNKLSQVTNALIDLLYPLQWVNTFIPILSEELIKYVQSFIPFIMGIEEQMFEKVGKHFLDDKDNVVILVFIKKGTIETSHNFLNKKKTAKKHLESLFDEYPEEAIEEALIDLKETKFLIDKERINKNLRKSDLVNQTIDSVKNIRSKLDKKMRNVFIKMNAVLFGDYKKYVSFIDEFPYFNKESFLANRPTGHKKFYNEFTQTGIFRHFLQNMKNDFSYFEKKILRYKNIIITKNSGTRVTKRKSSIFSVIDKKLFPRSNSLNKDKSTTTLQNSSGVRKSNNEILNKTPNPFLKVEKTDSLSGSQDNSKDAALNNCFFLTPYFISNTIIKSDITNIDDLVMTKLNAFQIDSDFRSHFNKKIFTEFECKELRFDASFAGNYKIYKLPGFVHEKSSELIYRRSLTDKDGMNFENIKSTVNESFRMVLTSEKIPSVEKISLLTALGTKFGRHYFSKILFQKKFLDSQWQVLTRTGFEDLHDMIFGALVDPAISKSSYEDLRKICKCTFYYYW